ncbi:MAG TPA: hypothetical protein VLB67_08785 [Acidimicrobiia bacterium]|nr:hypothetical protein [Acidimicrobiia bacterium]
MNVDNRFAQAFSSLDIADEAVRELHENCCQPLKSPRMEVLTSTLASARAQLADAAHDAEVAGEVVAILQDAGAQLGHLQVDCCAPARMKLYATTLENLSKIQRLLKRTFELEH